RFLAAPLLAAALGIGPSAADDAAAPDRGVRHQNGSLPRRPPRAPVTHVMNELERQSGASVRGSLLDPRDVTAEFKAVPLSQALARLLGDQNFALVYGEGGRLRVVSLLPGAQATAPRPAVAPTTTLPQGAPAITLEEFATLIDSQPPVKCDGPLADALGPMATYRQLLDTALSHTDASLRMLAVG